MTAIAWIIYKKRSKVCGPYVVTLFSWTPSFQEVCKAKLCRQVETLKMTRAMVRKLESRDCVLFVNTIGRVYGIIYREEFLGLKSYCNCIYRNAPYRIWSKVECPKTAIFNQFKPGLLQPIFFRASPSRHIAGLVDLKSQLN